MNLNVSEWKEFYLGKLFDIRKGKRLTAADQEDGNNNYIGAIDSNNGVANHIGQAPIHEGNTISLSYNGSVGEAFYQFEPYWATDDVNALYSYYDDFNQYIGLFIATVLRKEKYKFSYGRKWTLENMNVSIIKLPIQHNPDGTPYIDPNHIYSEDGYVPDWQFMEDYMKSLHHKPLTTKSTVGNGLALKTDEWKEFRVGDLFDLKPTKGKDSTELLDGNDIAYIGAKKEMNGFMMRCHLDGFEEWVSDGNCIVFICLGAGSAGYATYQKDDFIGMSGKTICGYNKNLNPIIGNFLVTILDCERPKYSFGRSWTGDRLKNTIIKLPIQHNPDGTPYIDPNCTYSEDGYVPDWQFMEDYMKSLPYGDRL